MDPISSQKPPMCFISIGLFSKLGKEDTNFCGYNLAFCIHLGNRPDLKINKWKLECYSLTQRKSLSVFQILEVFDWILSQSFRLIFGALL